MTGDPAAEERFRLLRLLGAAVLLFLPFLHNAYFFDDPFERRQAIWAVRHPLLPYSFPTDLSGSSRPNWVPGSPAINNHPFLPALALGAWWRLLGESEFTAHLWYLLVGLLSLFLMARVAARYTSRPDAAGWMLLLSPVFWVNHIHLYGDNLFLCFALLTALLHHRWIEKPGWGRAAGTGAAWALACLCRYHSALLLPLLALDAVRVHKRRAVSYAGFAAGAAALLVPWIVHEFSSYGASHFLVSFSVRSGSFEARLAFIPWIFLGAAVGPAVWGAAPFAGARILSACAGLAGGFFLFFAGPAGGFSGWESAQMAFWISVAAAACGVWTRRARRDPLLWLPALWAGVGGVFIVLYLTRAAARHFYLILPALILLAVRELEARDFFSSRRKAAALWAASFALSCGVVVADHLQSEVNRSIAGLAHGVLSPPGKKFFWGNDFMGYKRYLELDGWEPLQDPAGAPPGSVVLVPAFTNTFAPLRPPPGWTPAAAWRFPSAWPERVLAPQSSAGFHSSSWGALPFSFSRGDMEVFRLYRVSEAAPPPEGK